MKKAIKKIENIFAAAAFAEEGEVQAAKQLIDEIRPDERVRVSRFEKLMMAVTFAEAGEHQTAKDIMREEKRDRKQDRAVPRQRQQLRAPGAKR